MVKYNIPKLTPNFYLCEDIIMQDILHSRTYPNRIRIRNNGNDVIANKVSAYIKGNQDDYKSWLDFADKIWLLESSNSISPFRTWKSSDLSGLLSLWYPRIWKLTPILYSDPTQLDIDLTAITVGHSVLNGIIGALTSGPSGWLRLGVGAISAVFTGTVNKITTDAKLDKYKSSYVENLSHWDIKPLPDNGPFSSDDVFVLDKSSLHITVSSPVRAYIKFSILLLRLLGSIAVGGLLVGSFARLSSGISHHFYNQKHIKAFKRKEKFKLVSPSFNRAHRRRRAFIEYKLTDPKYGLGPLSQFLGLTTAIAASTAKTVAATVPILSAIKANKPKDLSSHFAMLNSKLDNISSATSTLSQLQNTQISSLTSEISKSFTIVRSSLDNLVQKVSDLSTQIDKGNSSITNTGKLALSSVKTALELKLATIQTSLSGAVAVISGLSGVISTSLSAGLKRSVDDISKRIDDISLSFEAIVKKIDGTSIV